MAQDRQGSGAPGFAAPSFNIPFQPNFQFNEFGNFLDGNGGFSQFVSGLGSQGLRQGGGDFVQQTEQRFNRPQIGGGANFKRETEPTQTFQTFHQSVEPPSFKVHRPKAPVRQRPPLPGPGRECLQADSRYCLDPPAPVQRPGSSGSGAQLSYRRISAGTLVSGYISFREADLTILNCCQPASSDVRLSS